MGRPITRGDLGLIVALCLGVATASAADGLRIGRPADVGLSADRLETALADYRKAVDADEVRGAVLLVACRGTIVLHEALGWRNVARRQPMRTDTLIRMASNTKAVVATGVLQLAEAGRLSLDEAIGDHLPAFANAKCRKLTIRGLLSHTSGLRIKTLFLAPLRARSAQYPLAPNLRLEVDRYADIGPAVSPGTSYSYNNPGFNTLGALLETRSGQSLEDYLAANVYRPLGMHDTSHRPPRDQLKRMAVVYERVKPGADGTGQPGKPGDKGPGWRIRFDQSGRMKVPFVRGSGGLVSTTADFARFCQMFLNRGRLGTARVLSAESVREATRPQTEHVYTSEELRTRDRFYGLGWSVRRSGVFGHGGSEGTYAFVDPRHELIVLVFTQSPGGKNPREAFFAAVVAAAVAAGDD